jgi:predicted Zn-ribbon and HTH transcriptional regulator
MQISILESCPYFGLTKSMSEIAIIPEKHLQAIRLKCDGFSYSEIGKRLNISRQRAQQLVRPSPEICALVYRRANGSCQNCGMPSPMGQIHHVESVEKYNDPSNLQYLCVSCHTFIHSQSLRQPHSISIISAMMMEKVTLAPITCKCCGYEWRPRVKNPVSCPSCKRYQ